MNINGTICICRLDYSPLDRKLEPFNSGFIYTEYIHIDIRLCWYLCHIWLVKWRNDNCTETTPKYFQPMEKRELNDKNCLDVFETIDNENSPFQIAFPEDTQLIQIIALNKFVSPSWIIILNSLLLLSHAKTDRLNSSDIFIVIYNIPPSPN